MKPLFVLLITAILAYFGVRLVHGFYHWPLSGRIAMSVMLIFTTIGHFKFTEGMTMMVPPAVPWKKTWVYLSGVFELAAAVMLLIPHYVTVTGWALIIFFILMLPANIYAALHKVNYQEPDKPGPGPRYLWFRIPLQLFFIGWVYCTAVLNT